MTRSCHSPNHVRSRAATPRATWANPSVTTGAGNVIERVMDGDKAALLFDPPYGVAYQSHMAEGGTASRFKPIENDDLKPEQLQQFLSDAFSAAVVGLRPGAAIYVCHANQRPGIYAAFEQALLKNEFFISTVIVRVKPGATMGWQDYRSRYGPILYGWRKGAERRKVLDRTETNVWQIGKDAPSSYVHPTQKPVALSERAIRNSSLAGDVVLDLFGGSGSTLIACEKTERAARLVELDPGYCDVICKRWERATGLKAERVGSGACA